MNTTVKKLTLRLILSVLALFSAAMLSAQSDTAFFYYDMTFVGRGESTTVGRVKVENITQNTSLDLNGEDVLRLTNKITTGIEDIEYRNKQQAVVYPNPSSGKATVTFPVIHSGSVRIAVTNVLGQVVTQGVFALDEGTYSASLPSLPSGTYIVSISGQGNAAQNVKWVSTGSGYGERELHLSGNVDVELPTITQKITKNTQKLPGVIRLLPADKQQKSNASDGMIKPLKRYTDNDANIVQMIFSKGDLLRFTGKNGNMTCIVMNAPTCSHDITFDFFACTDANGYHYAIINVGGVLWMAEDMRMVTQGVSVASDATTWKDTYSKDDAKAAYYNYDNSNTDGVYYNYKGAQTVLPEGWRLPTQGEIDYMVNAIGGYSVAADKLKSRESDAWDVQATGTDSLYFCGVAGGQLSTQGTFSSKGSMMRYWTRSTTNLKPNYWGIQNNTVQNVANKQVVSNPAFTGLRVRGCRQAPSVYSEAINTFFPAPKNTKVFANGPLGEAYTIANEKKKIFVDLSSSRVLGLANNFDFLFTRHDLVGETYNRNLLETKNISLKEKLKKSAAQNNANTYQNLLTVVWNRGTLAWSDDIWWVDSNQIISGRGTVSLMVHGDSTQNYACLDTITLTLPQGQPFTMPESNYQPSKLNMNEGSAALIYRMYEWYSRCFSINTADLNGDAVDDIILCVGMTIAVYDGVTYELLQHKTFTGDALRVAVGDVDRDNMPDIAIIYCPNTTDMRVEVYSGGDLSGNADYYTTATVTGYSLTDCTFFNDIKISDITGIGAQTIAYSTFYNHERNWKREIGESTVNLLQYDTSVSGYLKQIMATPLTNIEDEDELFKSFDIVPVRYRGSAFPADIMINGKGYRYDAEKNKLNECSVDIMSFDFPSTGEKFVFADNMVAGNFDNNDVGKEQLMFLLGHINYDNHKYKLSIDLNLLKSDRYGRFRSTRILVYSGQEFGLVNYSWSMSVSVSSEGLFSFPSIAAVRSAEPARVLKYVSHQTTLSEPTIYALLAAPPFFKYNANGDPYEYGNFSSMGTSWGKSAVSGSGNSISSSNSVSAIIGFEQEFNLPIVGTKVGGIEMENKLEWEWSKSVEKQYATTKSIEFTTAEDDAVILTTTFFDTYTYEIIRSRNVDEIGSCVNISIPGRTNIMGITLDDYERLAADNPLVPNLGKLFNHQIGYPFTYPNSKSAIKSNVPKSEVLWAMSGSHDENGFVTVGSGTDAAFSITLDETTTEAMGSSFSYEMEVVGTVFCVKAGAGYGYSKTNEQSHTEGVGHSIAGQVPAPKKLGDVPAFRCTVAWYKYKLGGQEFPIIYYVVQE